MSFYLEINNISHSYDKNERYVVENFSLSLNSGEIVCLFGPTGCGKTTLLRIIAGLEKQTKGSIVVNSKIFSNEEVFLPPEERNIGMMFQDNALFPHLKVEENILFGIQSLKPDEKKSTLNFLLKNMSIKDISKSYPHQLSGGEKQRVALARSIAPKPNILLMDEPFSELDDAMKSKLLDLTLTSLKKQNITAVVVTHNASDARKMADKLAIMENGKLRSLEVL